MRPKNKQRWNFIGLFLITLLVSALAIVRFYQRNLWEGTLFTILAGEGITSIYALVRNKKADANDTNVLAKMESMGAFIGNVSFALFCSFLAVYILISPEIRQKSLVTTVFAILMAVGLMLRIPWHFQRYKEYRKYKEYHD